MDAKTLKTFFNQFEHQSIYKGYTELNSGHINDTFFIETEGKTNYILQRINHKTFKDVAGLVNNKVLVSNHLKSKFSNKLDKDLDQKVLSFVKVKNSDLHY